jgi:hypothetical protein
MRVLIRNIILAGFLFLNHQIKAQPGFYIPKAGKIFFISDTATIFSDVLNYGQFGVGKKALVNFSGKTWENSPLALITDESSNGNGTSGVGGWIRFLSDSIRQQIIGGYNAAIKLGASFPRMRIQNKFGIELLQSSVKVRREFTFSDGNVYLHDQIFSVGNNDPGLINNYDSSKFFITANKPGSGYLIRENIRNTDGRVDFPVGTKINGFTPAAVQNFSSQGDDYYVNVFDSVRSSVFTGNNLASQSVNKTWEIGKRFYPGMEETQIFLQHLNTDEGNNFSANRKNAFISWYNGNTWDTGSPQRSPVPGYITSGNPITTAGVNDRRFYNTIASPSYFTKLTGFGDSLLQTKLWFNARRTDYTLVHVYWKTNPEKTVRYFIVQRRFANENNFSDIDTVASLVNGGLSLIDLNYAIDDNNEYPGISFYRLKVVDLNTTFFYSNIVAVGGYPGRLLNLLWPNPTQDIFYVSCDPVWKVEYIVIWNALGQKVKQEPTNGRNVIQLGGLNAPGTYFVGFIREGGQVIETKKLVVVSK